MKSVWETPQFTEVYHVNTTPYGVGDPGLRVQTFCHSISYRNWKHAIDPVRPNMIALLILSGNQQIIHADGEQENIRPGYFSIVNLSSMESDVITISPMAERYFVLFEKNQLLQNLLKEMFPGGLPSFHAPEPERLKKCFEDIRREIIRRNTADARIGGAAYRLLHEAMTQLPYDPLPTPLILAKNYIDNHFHEVHLCREQIAAAACVSISTLAALFRKHLNTTIWQCICDKRMENVKQLLTFSNKSIAQIALECGFSYSYYLTREFRSQFDMTPGEYRRQSRRSR